MSNHALLECLMWMQLVVRRYRQLTCLHQALPAKLLLKAIEKKNFEDVITM